MKTYLVGGAVRDQLLGLPVTDRDWLVTGIDAKTLIEQGYQAVGRDFTVFLHPTTREEHALPRASRPGDNERQQLEADLAHRDLTVNAMAISEQGDLIDPLNGAQDLQRRVLRHTPAFAEDPLRILRLARLSARLASIGFSIAQETRQLARAMTAEGALNALVAERTWSEIRRGLMEDNPVLFIECLRELGALAVIIPELERLFGVPQPAQHHPEIDTGRHSLMALQQACRLSSDSAVRFAALVHDLGKGTTPTASWPRHIGHERRGEQLVQAVCLRLCTPNNHSELARLCARLHTHCHRALELKPSTLLKTLEALDALRRPTRLAQFLLVCEADFRGRLGFTEQRYPQAELLRNALAAANQIDAAEISRSCTDRAHIPEKIRRARIKSIASTLGTKKNSENRYP